MQRSELGVYVGLRVQGLFVQEVVRPLQLDERMIALAGAISIDFDYFSQHSHGPGEDTLSKFPACPHQETQAMRF